MLEKVRQSSVCTPLGYKETAMGMILSNYGTHKTAYPIVLERMRTQGGVEHSKSWYTTFSHEEVVRSNPQDGRTYLAAISDTEVKPIQFMYDPELQRVRQASLVYMDVIPWTKIPMWVLNFCANLSPQKYVVTLLSERSISAKPLEVSSPLPTFQANWNTVGLLEQVTLTKGFEEYAISIGRYQKFGLLERPMEILVRPKQQDGNRAESLIVFSRWGWEPIEEFEQNGFSSNTLDKAFGISEANVIAPIPVNQVAAK